MSGLSLIYLQALERAKVAFFEQQFLHHTGEAISQSNCTVV